MEATFGRRIVSEVLRLRSLCPTWPGLNSLAFDKPVGCEQFVAGGGDRPVRPGRIWEGAPENYGFGSGREFGHFSKGLKWVTTGKFFQYYQEAPRELGIQEVLTSLSRISCVIHSSSSKAAGDFYDQLRRQTYMTPTSYLELIKLFTELLGQKMGELSTKLNRYKVGTKRLDETRDIVDKLKVDLTKLGPAIEQGKLDTAQLIIQVDKEEVLAQEKQAACEVDEKEAGEAAAVASEIKAECQRELDEALPEYYAAIKSLDALDKKDIQE
ncbi:unnamed protein product, partial [Polarella glacialis]